MTQNNGLFLDLRQAEADYPVSRRKLQQLIKERRLRAFRVDGKIILRREDLEHLLTSNPIGADIDNIVDAVIGDLGVKY